MPTDTSVNSLVINKLTKAQYETIQNPSETELYLVPDEMDTAPTSGSSNCVTSGGVYTAFQGKADKVVVESSMPSGGFLPNKVYNLGTLSGNTTFSMAAATDNTIANIWCWTFTTPSSVPTITWSGITGWSGGSAPTISASKSYEVSVMNGIAVIIEV